MIRSICLSAVLALAVIVPDADAGYYLSRETAQYYAGHYARTHHAVRGVIAKCWPKNHLHGDSVHYDWHKWTCVWVGYEDYGDGPKCYGAVIITGIAGTNSSYYSKTIVGERC